MAIVWRCALSVSEYAVAGKVIEVPEPDCPSCGTVLRPWGWYERWVREEGRRHLIWIRRFRCRGCEVTHALLPDFLHVRRLDVIEVIGRVIELSAKEVGAWKTSVELDLPFSTVRDWRTRCRQRAPELLQRVAAVALGVGAELTELPTKAVAALVAALKTAWNRSRERAAEAVAGLWRFWNAICSGKGLSTNTSPA